jgi:hypothetical protein
MDEYDGENEEYDDEYKEGDDDNEGGEEFEFRPDIKAYERVGLPGLLGAVMTGNFANIQRNINNMVSDPVERFSLYVDAAARNLSSKFDGLLSSEDIVEMIEHVRNIKNVEYKNPVGYILGYIASRGGYSINEKAVENIFVNVLPVVNNMSRVTEPDVIRYARLWLITRGRG